jgi:hypothetical protein
MKGLADGASLGRVAGSLVDAVEEHEWTNPRSSIPTRDPVMAAFRATHLDR